MSTDPLGVDDLAPMAQEIFQSSPLVEYNGYSYRDFGYGDLAWLRLMSFGHPFPALLMVTRLADAPPADPNRSRFTS